MNKGEKTSINPAMVARNILTILKSIVYIEPEEEITPSGISPRVWVEGLSITGESTTEG